MDYIYTSGPIIKNKIDQHIGEFGFITVDQYMALCLYDPEGGYYRTQPCIGSSGDFITAPEVSQLFGECIAFWLNTVWQTRLDAPCHIIELGPGRGTLIHDILRTLTRVNPQSIQKLTIHLVETSPILKNIQQQKLQPFTNIIWHDSFDHLTQYLPHDHCYFIANEFFDAFPIKQWIWSHGQWAERVITHRPGSRDLVWSSRPIKGQGPNTRYYPAPNADAVIEESIEQQHYAAQIFNHIARGQNAGIFIDYGYDSFQYGNTLQAVRHHQHTDPLTDPGFSDLTAHVNFANFMMIAQNCQLRYQLSTQRAFLKAYGIDLRLQQLLEKNRTHQPSIQGGYNRLTHPHHMGHLFKVLSVINNA